MLRTQSPVRALTTADREQALELCGRDPATNVFVAGRILEGALQTQPGALLGYADEAALQSLCWVSANLVPVECDASALGAFAGSARRMRRQCSSLFGPAEAVLPLWELLEPGWGRPRAVRRRQPMMVTSLAPRDLGVTADARVRVARDDEVDLVLPAAAAMFTEEIGYPPYWGSAAGYRDSIAALIARGRTFVIVERGQVVFKADVGSVALGVAQVQGVWVAPAWRGRGLAVPAMAAVVELVQAGIAPVATLYVNDYNTAARATYDRVGFAQTGTFATVLL